MKLFSKVKLQVLTVILTLGSAVAASAQSTWATCANEGGNCGFIGTMVVRYGAGSSWVSKTLTGGTACTNAVFGDPAYGIAKSCQLAWQACASENGTCSFTGTRVVRYGAGSSWTSQILTGGTACTNAVFGDPAFGVAKTCQYSIATSGSTTTTTAVPVTTTTLAPTTTTIPTTTTTVPTSGTRDKFKQPFAVNSIWNMPIGTGARYVAANLKAVPGDVTQWMQMPYSDDDIIIMRPNAPLTNIMYSSGGWGGNRCSASSSQVLATVPIPSDFVVPNDNGNESAAIVAADGRTILQNQPFARCTAGSYATSMFNATTVDIYGDGIRGSHGGSGMSAVGGALRIGELRPGQQGPRHAMKVAIYMKEAYKCSTMSSCFRWPATTADGYAVGWYGTGPNNPNMNNAAMKMGALLAIPTSVSIANLGLETTPAKMIAWTLQNYGAYVVDDTYAAQFAIQTEVGPDGDFKKQFQTDWGFSFNDNLLNNTPWRRDIQRLLKALNVVDNNGPSSIGGGGTPLQPLAPPIGN